MDREKGREIVAHDEMDGWMDGWERESVVYPYDSAQTEMN